MSRDGRRRRRHVFRRNIVERIVRIMRTGESSISQGDSCSIELKSNIISLERRKRKRGRVFNYPVFNYAWFAKLPRNAIRSRNHSFSRHHLSRADPTARKNFCNSRRRFYTRVRICILLRRRGGGEGFQFSCHRAPFHQSREPWHPSGKRTRWLPGKKAFLRVLPTSSLRNYIRYLRIEKLHRLESYLELLNFK